MAFSLTSSETGRRNSFEKASVVFDDTRDENLKEKLSEERKEKAAYAKKVF